MMTRARRGTRDQATPHHRRALGYINGANACQITGVALHPRQNSLVGEPGAAYNYTFDTYTKNEGLHRDGR